MRKLLIIMLIIASFVEITNAQSFYSNRRDRRWMFSYGLGFTTYHGDLYTLGKDKIRGANFNAGIGLRKKVTSQLSIRLDANFYQIQAADSLETLSGNDEPNRAKRNLSFRARNFEGSIIAKLNLIPSNGGYNNRPTLNVYIYAGIGISTNTPKGFNKNDNKWYKLAPLQTEGQAVPYDDRIIIVPYGAGLSFKVTTFMDLLFEVGRRSTNTDYLDDVSTHHVDLSIFDEIHAGNPEKIALAKLFSDRAEEAGYPARGEGKKRGSPESKDAYYIYQIRLEMYLRGNIFKNIFSPDKRKPKYR